MSDVAIQDEAPVRCMYLPMSSGGLLVPSSAVAEIVAPPPVESAGEGAVPWFAGTIDWRTVRVPLMNLEAALGLTAAETGIRARVAVLQSVDERIGRAHV